MSTLFKDVNDYAKEIQTIIEKEHTAIRSSQVTFYPLVRVESSKSSYGRWVVKYSPIHFRFFWQKTPAQNFALAWNKYHGSIDKEDK